MILGNKIALLTEAGVAVVVIDWSGNNSLSGGTKLALPSSSGMAVATAMLLTVQQLSIALTLAAIHLLHLCEDALHDW